MRIAFRVVLMLLSLSGCMHQGKPLAEFSALSQTQTRHFSAFDVLLMRGALNATVHTGFRQPKVVLKGDPEDLAYVTTRFEKGRLMVMVQSGYPKKGRIDADIQTKSLSQMDYQGSGRLVAPALNTPSLTLSIQNTAETSFEGQIGLRQLKVTGPGKVFINGVQSPYLALDLSKKARVQLIGVINSSNINLKGHAWLSMYWVKSRYLTLRAQDDSFVQLAGAVNTLDACLSNKAQFNGRYLRVERAFVKTSDESIAKINAVKRQHSFASDRSDIYYYNIANIPSDFMAGQGAVLDMRDWIP